MEQNIKPFYLNIYLPVKRPEGKSHIEVSAAVHDTEDSAIEGKRYTDGGEPEDVITVCVTPPQPLKMEVIK